MTVFSHHIYEYEKGIRKLILHTLPAANRYAVEYKLKKKGIAYHIMRNGKDKINVFFGNSSCIDVIKSFGDKSLTDYSPEEDFMLGIMLGYDKLIQTNRYLQRKSIEKTALKRAV